MVELPKSEFLDVVGDHAHRIAGTRISFDSVAYGFMRGQTVEEILDDFPGYLTREKVEGAIAFIKAYPREVIEYLADGHRIWEEGRMMNPPEIYEVISGGQTAKDLKPA